MQFSITALLFGLVAISSAASVGVSSIDARQAANGACCIANKSLKQDACTVNGAAGKCVPGGPAQCGGALNCVANNQLTCDNAVPERSGVLCRFQLPNGKIQDGAKQITSLSQAKVN
ncbi:hypothetical protein DPSP01_007082 [Paraphaeosphaeria sporulosa]|uniref:Uncharacterized protein n=1 Tax=Paraphaeosphaeria sporulosa TaxID=1460663 RepID=A0A177CGN7_9PLEO|nr:uncharacterized protein CC84DRAFT_1145548 [Paraphaeosphaeria sporulosa]OAG05857.1 hypothetical protein CC84DRAFT_1145548 [Paraphaeosphaeria sporulosa]